MVLRALIALAPSWWPGPRLGQDRVHPVEQHQWRSVPTGTDRQFSGSRKRNRSGYALLRSVSADTDLPIDRSSSAWKGPRLKRCRRAHDTKERVGRTIDSFKLANLPDVVKAMRREGWIIEQKLVPYAAAMRRRKPKLT
jgi:hypothetical protein